MSYQHMEQVMDAASKEETPGKAAATVINGIAALVENAGTDKDSLSKAVRLIRREAGALQEIIEQKIAHPKDGVAADQATAGVSAQGGA